MEAARIQVTPSLRAAGSAPMTRSSGSAARAITNASSTPQARAIIRAIAVVTRGPLPLTRADVARNDGYGPDADGEDAGLRDPEDDAAQAHAGQGVLAQVAHQQSVHYLDHRKAHLVDDNRPGHPEDRPG